MLEADECDHLLQQQPLVSAPAPSLALPLQPGAALKKPQKIKNKTRHRHRQRPPGLLCSGILHLSINHIICVWNTPQRIKAPGSDRSSLLPTPGFATFPGNSLPNSVTAHPGQRETQGKHRDRSPEEMIPDVNSCVLCRAPKSPGKNNPCSNPCPERAKLQRLPHLEKREPEPERLRKPPGKGVHSFPGKLQIK